MSAEPGAQPYVALMILQKTHNGTVAKATAARFTVRDDTQIRPRPIPDVSASKRADPQSASRVV